MTWCERGKGLRPDWATKGIEFLYLAANPNNTKLLSDEDFLVVTLSDNLVIKITIQDFKTLIEAGHSHVVGEKQIVERRHSMSPTHFESKNNENLFLSRI